MNNKTEKLLHCTLFIFRPNRQSYEAKLESWQENLVGGLVFGMNYLDCECRFPIYSKNPQKWHHSKNHCPKHIRYGFLISQWIFYQIIEFIISCLFSFVIGFSESIQNYGNVYGEIKEHQKNSDHQLFDYATHHMYSWKIWNASTGLICSSSDQILYLRTSSSLYEERYIFERCHFEGFYGGDTAKY